jgi:hypothetical protein
MADSGQALDAFQLWRQKHPFLADHLTPLFLSDPSSPSALALFEKKRLGVHQRTADKLHRFVRTLQLEIAKCEQVFKRRTSVVVGPTHFESPSENMTVRRLAIAEFELHELELAKSQLIQDFLTGLLHCAREGFDLFHSRHSVSGIQCYRLEPSFFKLDSSAVAVQETWRHARLARYVDFTKARIAGFKRPACLTDFPGFVHTLIQQTAPDVEEDFAYFPPMASEVSLSRCFADETFCNRIDPLIAQAVKCEPSLCVDQLTALAYGMIPDREAMPPEDQSIVLLLFFRVLFDRAYEKHSSVFCAKKDPESEKLGRLAAYPAKLFDLPRQMLAGQVGEQSLFEVFTGDPKFRKAAEILFESIFHSNPIDVLHDCHKCVLAIHQAALQNKMGDAADDLEDTGELLSFDDLFSLFFAVMLVSGVPDFFHLCWFVANFVPKNAVTPAFEYVLANMEALMIHARKFKLEALNERWAASLASG